MMSAGDPKDEYGDVSSNLRQFMTMRFAQLTVYLALTGFLLKTLLDESTAPTPYLRTILQVGGLLTTLLFWVHQERTMAYWNHFVHRAAELEKELGFKQYTTRPHPGLVSSFKAMRLFFISVFVFWASSFVWFR
jgi:hypothetical protein